jgi:hypothetical protein
MNPAYFKRGVLRRTVNPQRASRREDAIHGQGSGMG